MEAPLSRLDEPVTLADIIDQDSLQRVCMSFARFYGTGLAILDAKGQILVDVPADYAVCRRIGAHPHQAPVACSFDELAANTSKDGDEVATTCLCGLRYELARIEHQGELLGRLVFGPYRHAGVEGLESAVEEVFKEGQSASEHTAFVDGVKADLLRVDPRSVASAREATSMISKMLAVIVETGYARHLTSQIHIAAIQDAYNELTEKNRRLADSVEKLKDLDKLKSSFLATVSHELRTPLTSVIGYSEMLLEGLAGDLNDEQRGYVKTILDKGDHLLQIINEILDISKVESGTVHLSLEPFDLGDVMRQVADGLMPQAQQKGLTLSYDVAPEMPRLTADRVKTRQILLNLVSNALKFTSRGGKVLVHLRTGQLDIGGRLTPMLEVLVEDTGIGIPEEQRLKIFEAFLQLDSSSTRKYGGTGLGLSIVKHFVEAHGGRVWVESPEGGATTGTIFVVQLPVSPPPQIRATQMRGSSTVVR
ncbi:MAG: PocR ligand-binding domain-containing protein [Deltaproteobacteria bacterium]|nr:PocR ligand-binding domain-containing protein [Deltaproteobacteria bacterium]